ncbi:glycerophosphoryl diester phosphodiesterase membrane domain-containing protein [Asticcacaulis sp. DW145]|uniref:YciC family protein n=1 Tax=Asticcacaulis currens TaxID=2984210 RepID=A0ABT5IJI9_9CAUL|nr:YciC family protein [Asticcacaulis currens]MDC7695636.1 YciC family protein [Asticcacaulis currens]BEV11815.1 glycerophosphoryl diester phosphodiesterase membrane domain-containing protein [Asticcacaulis sp. DW145]
MFSAIFNRSFELLGRHFVLVFGTAFFIMGLPSVLGALYLYNLTGQTTDSLFESLFTQGWPTALYAVLSVALYLINYSVITEIAVTGIARTQWRLGEALRRSLVNIVPLMILFVLCGLMIGLGFLLLIVPGIILMLALSVACTAYIAEGKTGIFEAIQRSFDLTRGHRWSLLGVYLCLGLLQWVVGAIAEAPLIFVGEGLPQPLLIGASTLISTMSDAFSLVFSVAAYVCLRQAREGQPADSAADVFN